MTTPQKNSHADTVRQRRSSQKRSTPVARTRNLGTSTRGWARVPITGHNFPHFGNEADHPDRPASLHARFAHPARRAAPGCAHHPAQDAEQRRELGKGVEGQRFRHERPGQRPRQCCQLPSPGQGFEGPPRQPDGEKFTPQWLRFGLQPRPHHRTRPGNQPSKLGSRWASAVLTLVLGLMVYTMWTANTFKVSAAEVTGNQRLQAADVTQVLGLTGQPIFTVIPSKLEQDLRTAFPDLAKVSVQVAFPNHIRVAVVERMPILAWYQDGKTTWIDANGISFTPRGDVQGLVQIAANGAPPTPARFRLMPQKSVYDQAFISPDMVQAILTLAPQVPAGSPMVFDPLYGMGWQDARGWSVYFGQTTQDVPMKLKVYQSILDTFSKQGIQPTLISLAYLDAPFYK